MTNVLSLSMIPPSVEEYRFKRPQRFLKEFAHFEDVTFRESRNSLTTNIANLLKRTGVENWDALWTNNYHPDGRAVAAAMKEVGMRVVADVDDWFLEVPPGNIVVDLWQGKRRRWYAELLETADDIIVSTKQLQDGHGGTICPNFIVPEDWEHPRRPESDYTLICVAGGLGRAADFLSIEVPLKKALELDHVKVLFIGHMPDWATSYPVGKVLWSRWCPLDKYPQFFKWISPDIVASPLEHHDFNKAKSNLKWLEASAVGACFIGERWGELDLTVEDGKTGVLADNPKEWEEKLLWICEDECARREIAAGGRQQMLDKWTWDFVGPAWRKGVLRHGEGHEGEDVSAGVHQHTA